MTVSIVRGVGSYLPPRVVPNSEFERTLETSDSWIVERTGIKSRHIADAGVVTSDLATEAAKAALTAAGMQPDDIDVIIVGTTTPDETMPSTATRVQAKLGMTRGAAFDVNAACAGFVYALSLANGLLVSGTCKRALVIGAETYSRILNWEDRSTCVLFGDGAGAMVLEAVSEQEAQGRGILHCEIHSAGEYGDILCTTGGVSKTKTAGVLTMQGKEVFRHGVAKMADSVLQGLKATGMTLERLDLLVPHQANIRMLTSMAHKLGLPEDKVVMTVQDHANTSAASIPLALTRAVSDKKLTKDKTLALTALGAGLTWGCCIIKW